MPVVFLSDPPARIAKRPLTEDDAVDIWIARWLRVGPTELTRRYHCDPRRLYEIWEGHKFPASRGRARKRFQARFPGLLDRTDFGPHQTISKKAGPDQMSLFDDRA